MVPSTRVNGAASKNTGTAFKYGLMAPNMRGTGTIIRRMEKASFGMLMVTFSKESGKRTKPTGMEFICMSMEPSMRAIGKTICNMGRARRRGLMDHSMMENM